MLSFAVILVLAGVVQAREYHRAQVIQLQTAEEPLKIEPRGASQGRIVNGEIVDPEDIPYAVGIISTTDLGTRWCGGTLVSLNYVLTTSSCFSTSTDVVMVYLGASNLTDVDDIISATHVIRHYQWDEEENQDDIALLKLIRPAVVGATIRPIRLPNWRQELSTFENQMGTISGWGAISQNSPEVLPLLNLRSALTLVISNNVCQENYLRPIANTMICAATYFGSPCHGDIGAPLTITDPDGKTMLIGMFSRAFFLRCNSVRPMVFTRVAPYLDWIESNSDVVISDEFEYCRSEL